jgi:acetyl esterase/lipase
MSRSWSSLGLVLVLVTPVAVRSAGPVEVEVHKNIRYNDARDADPIKHKLDLYLPKGQKDYPVVFLVHGGAWVMGDKTNYGFAPVMGRAFAQNGVGMISISYRLSPKVKHPAHVEDVALAYAWAQKNIGKYGGRADQMFVCGHSAGAHLVALLATDERYLKAHSLSTKDIRGVIPISGIYNIPVRALPQIFGDDPEARKQASPLRHVKENLPPFCILYSDNELPGCGKGYAEKFATALREKGTAVEAHEIRDSNHVKIIGAASDKDDAVFKMILEFVRKNGAKK